MSYIHPSLLCYGPTVDGEYLCKPPLILCSKSVLRSWSEGKDELANLDLSLAYATAHCLKKTFLKD